MTEYTFQLSLNSNNIITSSSVGVMYYDGLGNMQKVRSFLGGIFYCTNSMVGIGLDNILNAMHSSSSSQFSGEPPKEFLMWSHKFSKVIKISENAAIHAFKHARHLS